MMVSLVDFIDKFGANTASLNVLLDELQRQRDTASRFYMRGDYQESLEAMQEALNGLLSISAESAALRQKALFWVYLTEYLIVSSASMLCGFLLWSLMVKRRYYREVRTTRLSQMDG